MTGSHGDSTAVSPLKMMPRDKHLALTGYRFLSLTDTNSVAKESSLKKRAGYILRQL